MFENLRGQIAAATTLQVFVVAAVVLFALAFLRSAER